MSDERRITINWEDGNLRLYAGGRLDRDTFLKLSRAGFKVKRGDTTFFAPFTPAREKLLLDTFGGELEEDDSDLIEAAEERAEKYESRADRNYTEYEQRNGTAKKMADAIPFGQPILIGHHSEGRDRRYRARIENNFRKGFEALETSNYWKDRAESALRRMEKRQTAPAIHRRIDELQKGLRKCERELLLERIADEHHWNRWKWFYENRLDFEKALLAALPEEAKPESLKLEQFGAFRWLGHWYMIERVNKTTVTYESWASKSKRKITDILPDDYMSPAEFEAAEKVQQRSGGFKIEGR